jgi:hypothetical protein
MCHEDDDILNTKTEEEEGPELQDIDEPEPEPEPPEKEDKKQLKRIDLFSDFSLRDITNKAGTRQYIKNGVILYQAFIKDLLMVLVEIQSRQLFILKAYNTHQDAWELIYKSQNDIQQILSGIVIKSEDGKKITAWSVYMGQYKSLFTYDATAFHTTKQKPNNRIFNVFQGWKWQQPEAYELSKIQLTLNHIKNVICSGDDIIYKYVLSWIANITQHPGIMNMTAIILKGCHGAGKNIWFTDIISKMFKGYSDSNIYRFGEFDKMELTLRK